MLPPLPAQNARVRTDRGAPLKVSPDLDMPHDDQGRLVMKRDLAVLDRQADGRVIAAPK